MSTERRTPSVAVHHLTKAYGSTTVLKDISFELNEGEIVGLLGENGAGKSTLIKILAGVVRADAGWVNVGAHRFEGDWQPAQVRQAGVAFIHQDPALFPDMTIEENVGLTLGFPVMSGAIDRKALRARTEEIIQRLAIPARPDDTVGLLSGAVRATIAVGVALADRARVVVLDEPTAALTAHEAARLFDGLRSIRDAGGTVVLVTHRIDEVMENCDRVVVLRDGSLAADVQVSQVSKEELVEHIVGSSVHLPTVVHRDLGPEVLSVEDLVVSGKPPVNFSVHRGEIVSLAGPVAAGHEEVAAALFGLCERDAGGVRLHGEVFRPATVRAAMERGVGYVPADRNREGLVFGFTAAENLFPSGQADDTAVGTRRETRLAAEVMQRFRVRPPDPKQEITAFSGGNAQKVLLARWLHRKPALVILCEPTAGVDVGARASIYELILEMSKSGTSFLLVSSDFEEVATLANRVVVFRPRKSPLLLDSALTVAHISAAALN